MRLRSRLTKPDKAVGFEDMNFANRSPRVSIITPVYNGVHFVRDAILSVADSTFQDYEHIVIDDGSTDNSLGVIEETVKKLNASSRDKVRVFVKPNSGEADTDNFGFNHSVGEFIIVLNADDKIGPNLILESLRIMDSHPDVTVTYPDWEKIDAKSKPLDRITTFNYTIERLVGKFYCIPGPGAMIRRTTIAKATPPFLRNPTYSLMSDFECWIRLAVQGPFRRVPGFHAYWRLHHSNASTSSSGVAWADEAIKLGTQFVRDAELNHSRPAKICYRGLSRAYLLSASRHFDDLRVRKWKYLVLSLKYGAMGGRLVAREDFVLFLMIVFENFTGRRTRQNGN